MADCGFERNDERERAATAKGYLAMRVAMRECPRERMISVAALVLAISICFLVPKATAQSDKYPKMARQIRLPVLKIGVSE